MKLSSEQKKIIGNFIYQMIMIFAKSIRDLPFGIVIFFIALLFIAPNHVWNEIFQEWEKASASQTLQLIPAAKNIISLVWIVLFGSHFITKFSIFSKHP